VPELEVTTVPRASVSRAGPFLNGAAELAGRLERLGETGS
jgi:hypothetical protein